MEKTASWIKSLDLLFSFIFNLDWKTFVFRSKGIVAWNERENFAIENETYIANTKTISRDYEIS